MKNKHSGRKISVSFCFPQPVCILELIDAKLLWNYKTRKVFVLNFAFFLYIWAETSPSACAAALFWISRTCCPAGTGIALHGKPAQGSTGQRGGEKLCPAAKEQIFWPRTGSLGITFMFLWYSFFLILAIPFSAALVWWWTCTSFYFGFQVELQMYLLAKLSSLETSFSFTGKDFYVLFFSLVSVMIVLNFFHTKLHSVGSAVFCFKFVLHNKHIHAAQAAGLSPLLQAVQAVENPAEQAGVWKARNEIKKCHYSELILKTSLLTDN